MKKEKFTKMYEEHSNLIIKMIVNHSGDMDLAQEICQYVFVQYYENMDMIADKFAKAWLMLTAKHALIDYQRKHSRRKVKWETEYQGRMDVIMEDNTERVVEALAQTQLSFRIMEDLKARNEEWYQVIAAVCVQEMSHEEAAEYLQISPQVLRSRLYRARKYVRYKFMSDYEEI